ncbi:MAG TPA: ArsA family ATPase [Bryobacteraceae bacterium]|nr:ArsA family ATPase [Bryobacteraceae bacterium]
MRILLFSGKGGVGKTSIAAATGVHLARLGKRTLILSVDPAHSLADAFDLGGALFHGNTADPLRIGERLWLQEVNINHEVKRHWKEISAYVSSVLRTTGIEGVEAEEMAIFPGMEELSAMMYVNSYRRGSEYEVVVLDCAPTAESLRFVSLPTTLGWYMKHIFGFQRNMLKALRPLAKKFAPVELPPDNYFRNIQELFHKVDGMDKVLEDASVTSVRLVTNPEKMVLRETQRAFVYFTMHNLTVDGIIVNRVLPVEAEGSFFDSWRRSQQEVLKEIEQYFAPVPVHQIPMFSQEVLGSARLEELAAKLYAADEDPSVVSRNETPYRFVKTGEDYEIRISMPFAEKAEIGLFKKQDELVVEVGTVRRHVGLPTSMASLQPVKARLDGSVLVVDMRETL